MTRRRRPTLPVRSIIATVLVLCGATALAGCANGSGPGSASRSQTPSASSQASDGTGGSGTPADSGTPGASATPGAPGGPGGPSGGKGPGGPAVAVPASSLTCAGSPAPGEGRLPVRTWKALAVCPLPVVTVDSNGSPQPEYTGPPRTVTGDLGPLVAALDHPDAAKLAEVCPMSLVLLPRFWLVDSAGNAYRPHVPVNSCRQPRPDVVAALEKLRALA